MSERELFCLFDSNDLQELTRRWEMQCPCGWPDRPCIKEFPNMEKKMRSAHIICGKCGSTNVNFRIEDPCTLPELEHCGVDLICDNCGELTSIEELNEQLAEEQRRR